VKNLEYWLLAQAGVELLLIGLVALFLYKTKSLGRKLTALAAAENPVAGKVEDLTRKMGEWERRLKLAEELTHVLAERLGALSAGQPSMGGFPSPPMPSSERHRGASLRAQVEALSRQGFPPEDIARRLGLQLAEVKVALDLARVRPA
jgi:hypothetical protein